MTGLVKTYDTKKGYGFITPLIGKPGQTDSIYFHATALIRAADGTKPAIPAGAEVSFDLVRANQGLQAANVRLRTVSASVLLNASVARRNKSCL